MSDDMNTDYTYEVEKQKPPDFEGSYFVWFVGDAVGDPNYLQLDGATYDSTGIPIFIYMKDGTAFNWLNIAAVAKVKAKKRSRSFTTNVTDKIHKVVPNEQIPGYTDIGRDINRFVDEGNNETFNTTIPE